MVYIIFILHEPIIVPGRQGKEKRGGPIAVITLGPSTHELLYLCPQRTRHSLPVIPTIYVNLLSSLT